MAAKITYPDGTVEIVKNAIGYHNDDLNNRWNFKDKDGNIIAAIKRNDLAEIRIIDEPAE